MNASVEPHQTATSAIAPVVALEGADVVAHLLDHLGLGRGALHVRAVEALHVARGRRRPSSGAMAASSSLTASRWCRSSTVGVLGGLVGVVREDVPAAELELVEAGQRNEVR